MAGSFFGLNTAISGIFSAQKHLSVINNNISNVNTPGYSRQQAVQVAATPYKLNGIGLIGTGSDISSIRRIRDEYLDYKYWSENQAYGEWEAKMELLAELEVTFNEPSKSGFTTIMNEFYNALQELVKDPSADPQRSLVQQTGVTFAKYFNSLASQFEKVQADINQRVRITVEEINSLASQIQQMNKQIYTSELNGAVANDLRDRRALLVDNLSKLVDIDVNEVTVGKLPNGNDEKHFFVTINGKALVSHFNVSELEVTQRDESMRLNEEDISDLYEVKWKDGNKFIAEGGEIKALLDVRDGNDGALGVDGKKTSPSFKGVPFYIRQMNQFVRTFAMAFNEGYIDANGNGVIEAGEDNIGHADGYGLDPSGSGNQPTGIRFFTMIGDDGKPMSSEDFINGQTTSAGIMDRYKNITAKNFSVSFDILDDHNNIAAADAQEQTGNMNVISELINMRHDRRMFAEGAPEDYMKSLVATLGIDSQQYIRYAENQENLIKQIENRRAADSGVSLDEEMANMVRYQHAYNASARMIVTMSEIYDTLINRLGVG